MFQPLFALKTQNQNVVKSRCHFLLPNTQAELCPCTLPGASPPSYALNFFSRRELATTETDETAMAAAQMAGVTISPQ